MNRGPRSARIGLYLFLLSSAAFFALPLYVMVVTSLKSMPEIREGSLLALPADPSLSAWRTAWAEACIGIACQGIRIGFWNSIAILVPGVIVSVAVGALNGYALSQWQGRFADRLLFLLIAAGFIPYQVLLYPLVRLMSEMGLFGTLPGIVLIHTLFSLPILTLIFRNYYVALPSEILKAARVDGAGYWQSFRFIVLPLSAPILIVAAIIQITGIWNDFLRGLVFAGRDWLPMTVQLNNLVGSARGAREYNVEMAATLITAALPLAVYLASGRFFVRGIVAGSVKG
jgi:glucose/mannose transport system permease protein